MRTALQRFLAGAVTWPPFTYFQEHGQAALYVQMKRHGGPTRWATELGLPLMPPSNEVAGWSENRVRAELQAYLDGKTTWPTWRQFTADRRKSLRKAVRWLGGAEHWATEMGVTMPAVSCSEPQRWPYPRMKAEVRRLAGRGTTFPSPAQFRAAGLGRLERSIRHHRGVRQQLAADLGLQVRATRRRRCSKWTDAEIMAALDVFIDGRDAWPSQREFMAAGLGGLHSALNKHKAIGTWAVRYGFERPIRGKVGRRVRALL